MKQISIEIIHKCPNNCMHCSSCSGPDCTLMIKTENVKKLIDSAVELNTKILSISGGEPLLHPGLLSIVKYAKKKEREVYIYTSGISLNNEGQAESIDLELVKELHKSGVDKIIFDLPAINETIYNKFMGTSGYQKFVFESIRKVQSEGIFSEIHFVPTKLNVEEIPKVMEFAEKEGINMVSFLGLVPHGRTVQNINQLVLSSEESERIKQLLNNISNEKVRVGIPLQLDDCKAHCYAGRNKLCVRYDGKVFGCEAFKYIQLVDSEGNIVRPDSIYEKSLEDIFFHSEYLKLGQKFVADQMKNCRYTEKCPVQRMMRKKLGI